MGTVSSKDTRRISFDNTFAVSPALIVHHKSIGDESVLDSLDIDAIAAVSVEKDEDLVFSERKIPPLQEKEAVEVDYWANRIESLKQEHQLINKIIENEYEKTLQDTSILLKKPYSETQSYNKMKPCFDWRSKIMQCYEDNAHQPLVCAPIVNAFNECVSSCRLQD